MAENDKILSSAEVDFLLDAAGSDSPDGPEDGREQSVTMRGDLEQINLSDIFQTLAMTKMEGVLRVRNPLEQRLVLFRDGKARIQAPTRVEARRLGQRLVQAGLATPEQLRAALVRQRKDHTPLGKVLVADGVLTEPQLEEVLDQQASEDLFTLFTWRHGTFEFFKGPATDPDQRARFEQCPEFEVSSLLLEIARRADEWQSILDSLASLDEVPHRVPGAATAQLDEAAQAIVRAADGRTTYRQLAEHSPLGVFGAARLLRDLVCQGVLANVADPDLVQLADDEAAVGRSKQAVFLLQTLRDRPGQRTLDVVRKSVDVLVAAGERRLAGNLLLEIAQQVQDGEQALAMARRARELAPNDAETISFLRTTLVAHGAPDSPELEQCTVDLVDALSAAGRFDNAMDLLADARATGGMRPQLLLREARVLQKQRDPAGAARVLTELAEIYRAQGDRRRTIETYESILRLDRTRTDVRKLLAQLRRTRAQRVFRAAAAAVTVLLLAATGIVWWQQRARESAVRGAAQEIGDLLRDGQRAAAREALLRWSEVLGEGEAVDDLRRQVDFADAAEHTRLVRLEQKRKSARLAAAAAAFGNGDLREAFAIYVDMHRRPDFTAQVEEIVNTRFLAVLDEIDRAAKTMPDRLPPPPTVLTERRQLLSSGADLAELCPPGLLRVHTSLRQFHQENELPGFLHAAARERAAVLLSATAPLFDRAERLTAAYAEALERSTAQRRLDPLFKEARRLESQRDYAGALALYRNLVAEQAGDAELQAHFRERAARNEAIANGLGAIAAATAAGDGATAQRAWRSLRAAFPELPLGESVRLPFRIETVPAGARVRCNGAEVGRTPCFLALRPTDQNRIEVDLPGHQPANAMVAGDEPLALRWLLVREPAAVRRHDHLVELPPADCGAALVFADRGGTVVALDPVDGAVRWTFRSGDLSGLLGEPRRRGNELLVPSLDGDLRALDLATGSLIWSLPGLPTETGSALAGETLALATPDGRLVAVDLERRAVAARAKLGFKPGGRVLLCGNLLVVFGEEGRIAAHSLPDLAPVWQLQRDELSGPSATLAGNDLAVAGERGHLAVFDLRSGEARWQRTVEGGILGAPAVDGDSVWIASPSAALCHGLVDGAQRGGLQGLEQDWSGQPVIASGCLLLPSRDGVVHAFDLASRQVVRGFEGSRRVPGVFCAGDRLVIALPDRRIHFYASIR
ncbi:MAG: DUF4388 domain-containing protein [Planctomycetes bacterium]|nr:DUF4388 domain-containing protein [Planctomycetota bacterium]